MIAKESGSNDQLVSFKPSDSEKQTNSTFGSSRFAGGVTSRTANQQQQQQQTRKEISSNGQKKKGSAVPLRSSDKRDDVKPECAADVKDRSSRFKSTTAPIMNKASSFGQVVGQETIDTSSTERLGTERNNLPKPAPRSVAQSSNKLQSSSVMSPAFGSSVAGSKRITNPRQNHGIAVAPPQLPLSCTVTATAATSTINQKLEEESAGSSSDLAAAPVQQSMVKEIAVQHSQIDESAIDFSQSPIAQRLLKHSKDYKGIDYSIPDSRVYRGSATICSHSHYHFTYPTTIPYTTITTHPLAITVSELNSPYESDNDHPQTTSILRGQKLSRGICLTCFHVVYDDMMILRNVICALCITNTTTHFILHIALD